MTKKLNKIEKLIAELCPDGVEFKELHRVARVTIGEFVHKNKQNPNGKYPVFNGGTSETGFYDEYNNTGNKIIISARGANAGFVNKILKPYWAGNSCYSIGVIDENEISWMFIFYYLKSNQNKLTGDQQKGGIPAVSKTQVEKFKIPIPPIKIQEEIVKILDNFTELEAELGAELGARKKQYEYYRDEMLSFEDGEVEWKTIDDISKKVSSGGTPKTGVSEYYNGDISWLRTQEVDFGEIWDTGVKITESGLKNSSAKWIPKNCVIVAMYGATVGKIAINKIPMTTNQACANIQLDENIVNYRYVFHFLTSQYNYIKSLGTGSQTNINAQIVKKIKIPIPYKNGKPDLEKQKEIVAVLDKFDALVNDISIGLPAEIKARRQQYEYYREKLLNFKEKK